MAISCDYWLALSWKCLNESTVSYVFISRLFFIFLTDYVESDFFLGTVQCCRNLIDVVSFYEWIFALIPVYYFETANMWFQSASQQTAKYYLINTRDRFLLLVNGPSLTLK